MHNRELRILYIGWNLTCVNTSISKKVKFLIVMPFWVIQPGVFTTIQLKLYTKEDVKVLEMLLKFALQNEIFFGGDTKHITSL